MRAVPRAFLLLGCLLFLALRIQRLDAPPEPAADEGVYLHVARHLADSGDALSSWYFIHRGGLFPEGELPYRQRMVQPGLPLLLAPAMEGDPHRTGRILILLIAAAGLAGLVEAARRIGGIWAAAGAALWTGLSFSQIEYGALIHTETPMAAITYVSLALLLRLLPGRPGPAGLVAGAVAGLGLWFRTNGVFLPLALALVLLLRRKEFPRAGLLCLAGGFAVMAPLLVYSALLLGGPLASDSGDILWAASLEDFRSLHPAPLGPSHLIQQIGLQEVLLRPVHGTLALLHRLWEADHGRTMPLLGLALFGLWLRRGHVAVQALLLGTLPTLAVTIWVSPVSWCDRYLHFLFPMLYALAGLAVSHLAARAARLPAMAALAARLRGPDDRLPGRFRGIRPGGFAVPAAFLILTLPFVPPHRFHQRQLAVPAAAPAWKESLAGLDRRLEAERDSAGAEGFFLVGTGYSRYHLRK